MQRVGSLFMVEAEPLVAPHIFDIDSDDGLI
jgi:hypothetical protein